MCFWREFVREIPAGMSHEAARVQGFREESSEELSN